MSEESLCLIQHLLQQAENGQQIVTMKTLMKMVEDADPEEDGSDEDDESEEDKDSGDSDSSDEEDPEEEDDDDERLFGDTTLDFLMVVIKAAKRGAYNMSKDDFLVILKKQCHIRKT